MTKTSSQASFYGGGHGVLELTWAGWGKGDRQNNVGFSHIHKQIMSQCVLYLVQQIFYLN